MPRAFGSVLALLLCISGPASADLGLYCRDGELIQPGATQAEVLLECGEPLTRQVLGTVESGAAELLVVQWVYDRGEGSFLGILTFHGATLVTIESGERR